MIISVKGDLLADDAYALVNPVNCVGVMGAGLALKFKQAHPNAFRRYVNACAARELRIGQVHVSSTQDGRRYIVHFPTKYHWRDKSTIDGIEAGLVSLVGVIGEIGVPSIAVPALGAGLGGLSWSEVEPVIRKHLEPLEDVEVRLYAPH